MPETISVTKPEINPDDNLYYRRYAKFSDLLFKERVSFLALARKLKEPLEEQRWQSVIADEISGHFPALFVHRLMKRVAKANGTDRPARILLGSGRIKDSKGIAKVQQEQNQEAQIKAFLEAREHRLGPRTLIVTEYIDSGNSIERLLNAIPSGVGADVAAMRISPDTYNYLEMWFPRSVFYDIGATAAFYGARGPAGLYKPKGSVIPIMYPKADRNFVGFCNHLVVQAADEIYEEVFLERTPRPRPVSI